MYVSLSLPCVHSLSLELNCNNCYENGNISQKAPNWLGLQWVCTYIRASFTGKLNCTRSGSKKSILSPATVQANKTMMLYDRIPTRSTSMALSDFCYWDGLKFYYSYTCVTLAMTYRPIHIYTYLMTMAWPKRNSHLVWLVVFLAKMLWLSKLPQMNGQNQWKFVTSSFMSLSCCMRTHLWTYIFIRGSFLFYSIFSLIFLCTNIPAEISSLSV